jgi:hypothetical protein
MEIPRRSIDFVQFGQITFCVLICEDLAQSDTLPEVLRRVGPTLVYAPLLDGPQITSRWAARYASVFADPGSAVLTLTSSAWSSVANRWDTTSHRSSRCGKTPPAAHERYASRLGSAGILLTACTGRVTQRTLADAFAGAPWWVELGVPEPSPRLRAAIAEIGNAARRAAAADALPTMRALVAEVEQNGNGVAALSRRVLQSRIAARRRHSRALARGILAGAAGRSERDAQRAS